MLCNRSRTDGMHLGDLFCEYAYQSVHVQTLTGKERRMHAHNAKYRENERCFHDVCLDDYFPSQLGLLEGKAVVPHVLGYGVKQNA